MTKINPWINFNGNALEAFTFYKSVFGGEYAPRPNEDVLELVYV